jgi:hypothetical protein
MRTVVVPRVVQLRPRNDKRVIRRRPITAEVTTLMVRSQMDTAESMAEGSQPSPQAGCPPAPVDGLSQREVAVLAFERQWWKYAGAKEKAIREQFAMSSTRYYQILNQLIDKQEAMQADPMLVKRLRKMRTARQRTRAARRLGIESP